MHATCPHCQTVFTVSDENLKVADGFVRCGICKEVFNALEKDHPADKKESTAKAETKSTEKPVAKENIKPAAESKKAADKKTFQAADTIVTKNQAKPAAPQTAKPAPANFDTTQSITAKPATAAAAPEKAKPAVASASKDNVTHRSDHAASRNNLFDGVQSKLIPDEYRIPELHNTYSLWKDLSWSIAILVLTASLFVEYTWFNRNELIRNPQLRPLLTQFCKMTDCGTMDLREPGEIEMITRNIYTHPNVKNALMISGSLINHAGFEQPYPNILIDFSNVRGEVTASRIFTPEDYLLIKLSSLKPLAPNVPVDFTIEIQDPGKNAMTYEFSFL